MNFDFELILFYAIIVTGIITFLDTIYFSKYRVGNGFAKPKLPILIDYSRSFFPVLIIVFLLRSFVMEPFRIPSGSLEPTLLKGDFILVNKYSYGTRLPILHEKVFGSGIPKRGDIMVLRWPADPAYNFIKRVIGLPGDHIKYVNKELTINNQVMTQEFIKKTIAQNEVGDDWEATEKEENLMGFKHHIYINPNRTSRDYDLVVPDGMYFVMGDNRDDSADSRYFGFVPDKNIVGKAMLIWFSWDSANYRIRLQRMAHFIH